MRETMMRLQEKFRTPRLLLTRIGPDDLDEMIGMHRDARLAQALGGMESESGIARLLEEFAQQWETDGFGWWSVRDPASGRFVGRGGLRRVRIDDIAEVEVGFVLVPEYWNRGIATELARVSVAQGFVRLALPDVVGFAPPGNYALRRVMEKTGLIQERELVREGAPQMLYRLTSTAWLVGAHASAGVRPRATEELVAG
jgi:ribosomal-protein-alanine N-acetyltransferase